MKNTEIARILREMGGYYEMKNEPFKPRAYTRAADFIDSLDQQLEQIYEQSGSKGLRTMSGVGQGIAEHIEELLKTGRLKKYEALKKKMPVNLTELTSVEGIGAKKAGQFYKKLKIKNLKELKRAVEAHKIAKGFGKKTEENILKALNAKNSFGSRYLLGYIAPLANRLKQELEDSRLFERVEVGGSFRRRQETVGDLDILAVAKQPAKAMDFFVKMPEVGRVLEHGLSKSEIKLDRGGIQVDLRIVPKESWGAALIYFTGDLAHNIKLRKKAIDRGWKLSEYGITSPSPSSRGGEKGEVVKFKTEKEVYNSLGMDWIPPELRTDSGEIEVALAGKLPKLINYGDVKGDLQVQTNWTDGTASIEEMALAAQKFGREYIAITDHTKTLHVARGLDEKKLLQQGREIDRLNSILRLRPGQNSKFQILKGAEVNILKDGSLDIADSTLSKLDVVGVSVHSHFELSRADQTKRIIRAISNPHVDILFHPTTRLIQKREPIDFDFEAVLRAAKKYRVALEINAYPQRLDLRDTMIRQAIAAGVKLTIDSDAHATKELDYIQFGEAIARRGWATSSDILNTKSADELLKYFRSLTN